MRGVKLRITVHIKSLTLLPPLFYTDALLFQKVSVLRRSYVNILVIALYAIFLNYVLCICYGGCILAVD